MVAAVCAALGCDEMTPRNTLALSLRATHTAIRALRCWRDGGGAREAGAAAIPKATDSPDDRGPSSPLSVILPGEQVDGSGKRSRITKLRRTEAAATAAEFHVWVQNGMPSGKAATAATAAAAAREAAVVAAISERLSDDHDAGAPSDDVVPSDTLSASPPPGETAQRMRQRRGSGRAPTKANIQFDLLRAFPALAAVSSAATVAAPTAAAVPTPAARGPSNWARGREAAANAEPRRRQMATGRAGSTAAKRGREPRLSAPDAAARLASCAAASTCSGDVAPSQGGVSPSASPLAKMTRSQRGTTAAPVAAEWGRGRRRRSGSVSASPVLRSQLWPAQKPWRCRLRWHEGPIGTIARVKGGSQRRSPHVS
jgi:hypothetical protein